MTTEPKWHDFDRAKGSRQKRPPLYKLVLVRTHAGEYETQLGDGLTFIDDPTLPPGLAIGYRKDGGGDKQSPYFVIPGIGGRVSAWCDCLPEHITMKTYRP